MPRRPRRQIGDAMLYLITDYIKYEDKGTAERIAALTPVEIAAGLKRADETGNTSASFFVQKGVNNHKLGVKIKRKRPHGNSKDYTYTVTKGDEVVTTSKEDLALDMLVNLFRNNSPENACHYINTRQPEHITHAIGMAASEFGVNAVLELVWEMNMMAKKHDQRSDIITIGDFPEEIREEARRLTIESIENDRNNVSLPEMEVAA